MSKKDFELIAASIQEAHRSESVRHAPCGVPFTITEAIERTAETLADHLSRSNPRFDRERFLRACVPGANVRARTR